MAGKKKVLVDVARAGTLGGYARAEKLSAEELSAAGANAVKARWEKYYKEHPEKLQEKLARQAKKRKHIRKRTAKNGQGVSS